MTLLHDQVRLQSDEAVQSGMDSPLAVEKALANSHVRTLRGVRTILDYHRVLQDFAAETGQNAAMHGLQFNLENEYARRKTPHLVCIVAGHDVAAPMTPECLLGCVLLFEYRVASLNTGFFATGESNGVGTVIAPVQLRAQVAAIACQTALRQGRMVLTCFRSSSAQLGGVKFPMRQRGFWAAQVREVKDQLRLCNTYRMTLATLGKRTRTHLRYYRKRLQCETGCVFVANAASHISGSEFEMLNTTSLDPIDQGTFDLQFRASSQVPGGFVCGLRAADGRWLSLAGGWRQGHASLLQWQMNAAGFPKLSLSTAFRAYLIEHEVSLGTNRLCFVGGTSHSISHAFEHDYAVDLILRRRGLLLSTLVRLIPYFAERDRDLANRGNFLVNALRNRNINWKSLSQSA